MKLALEARRPEPRGRVHGRRTEAGMRPEFRSHRLQRTSGKTWTWGCGTTRVSFPLGGVSEMVCERSIRSYYCVMLSFANGLKNHLFSDPRPQEAGSCVSPGFPFFDCISPNVARSGWGAGPGLPNASRSVVRAKPSDPRAGAAVCARSAVEVGRGLRRSHTRTPKCVAICRAGGEPGGARRDSERIDCPLSVGVTEPGCGVQNAAREVVSP
jgi:hypothetical protein